jgi:hypothetical protein
MKLSIDKTQPEFEAGLTSIQELQRRARELTACLTTSDNFPKIVDITSQSKNAGKDPVKSLLRQKQLFDNILRECSHIQTALLGLKHDLGSINTIKYEEIGGLELPLINGFTRGSGRTIHLNDREHLKLIHNAILK